jgi:hypothetical protein
MIMIRPDGHIGFRYPSAEPGAFAALDRHLSSYLIPDPAAGPSKRRPPDESADPWGLQRGIDVR